MRKKIKDFFKMLGPGFVSGAADNDPAGIATYAQIGAQFGYGQLWTALFALPLLTAVQEACARIGLVTGKGLAKVIRENYSRKVLYAIVAILIVANTINIGADIGAMAAAAQLVIPIPFVFLVLVGVLMTLLLEVFVSYRIYARYLKWLAAVSLVYLATVFVVAEPWGAILHATFVPHIEFNFTFLLLIAGNIGTTLAPYLFFWEASQEVEEDRANHRIHRDSSVSISNRLIKRMRTDNFVGMFTSQLITWSIIVVAGTILFGSGITNLRTAADVAQVLVPLVHTSPHAGYLAKLLFAVGIISAGLLVVPILSGSAAYALAEAGDWRSGLNVKLKRAHGFYGVITIATLIGLAINFIGVDIVKLLVYTSVLNGVAAIPLLFIISRIAGNKKIMGEHVSGGFSQFLIILAAIIMLIVVFGAILTFGR